MDENESFSNFQARLRIVDLDEVSACYLRYAFIAAFTAQVRHDEGGFICRVWDRDLGKADTFDGAVDSCIRLLVPNVTLSTLTVT